MSWPANGEPCPWVVGQQFSPFMSTTLCTKTLELTQTNDIWALFFHEFEDDAHWGYLGYYRGSGIRAITKELYDAKMKYG